jgi:hypothetical protein
VSLFHRHQWQEVARRFVPPAPSYNVKGRDFDGSLTQMVYDFANGYTVVELRCKECGKVSSEHIQGEAT